VRPNRAGGAFSGPPRGRVRARNRRLAATALLLSGLLLTVRGENLAGQSVTVAPGVVELPAPGFLDFERGFVERGDVTVDVGGLCIARLAVRSRDSDLGGYGKPLEDLEWRSSERDGFRPIGTGWAVASDWHFGGFAVDTDWRMALRWRDDLPDRYGAGLEFGLQVFFCLGGRPFVRARGAGAGAGALFGARSVTEEAVLAALEGDELRELRESLRREELCRRTPVGRGAADTLGRRPGGAAAPGALDPRLRRLCELLGDG